VRCVAVTDGCLRKMLRDLLHVLAIPFSFHGCMSHLRLTCCVGGAVRCVAVTDGCLRKMLRDLLHVLAPISFSFHDWMSHLRLTYCVGGAVRCVAVTDGCLRKMLRDLLHVLPISFSFHDILCASPEADVLCGWGGEVCGCHRRLPSEDAEG
jgi:hypothetical protein